jgi:D-tyrosyl-tRNA(Tyr) deacylase
MKIVVQRVKKASVSYENVKEEISKGLVVFVGIGQNDKEQDIEYMVKKIVNLRIFENELGKMDKSVLDIDGELLVVSEFTLYGDCRKGNRPDFTSAAKHPFALQMYNNFVDKLKTLLPPEKIKTGKFAAHMIVEIVNDGPVTIILET